MGRLQVLAAAVVCCLGMSGASAASAATPANPIQIENSHPGDSSWQGAVTAHVNFLHPPIDGYAGATSVRPGGTIAFYVNVPSPERYRVEISRLGWYGGAGGRRLTCLVGAELDSTCSRDEQGAKQAAVPAPAPGTGEVNAGWRVTDQLQVPANWVTGYYVAIFKITSGSNAGQTGFAPFIVQAPVGDHSRILVEVPSNTWQAYNGFGGEDLYTTPQAVKVSFDRPYQHHHLFRWEYPLLRYLERGGYDVTYVTDDDVDRDPSILLDHQVDIAAGHGEYWTQTIRDAWEAARAHGVNLAFMGANTGYWQVRYEDGDRTMVSYKSRSDPEPDDSLKTIEFRHLRPPRPECELEGEQSNQRESETGSYFNYTVTKAGASDPWFAGSGLKAGSSIPGLVGFEFDSVAVDPSCPVPPVSVLLRFSGRTAGSGPRPLTADAVRYRACSGSEVFDGGSLFFSWGLDSWRDPEFLPPLWPSVPPGDSPALQRIMANALADMQIAHPRMRPSGVLRLSRHGSVVRVDPGVPDGSVSVSASAVQASATGRLVSTGIRGAHGLGALSWHPRLPPAAQAVIVQVTVRTGQIRDARRYVVLTDRRGRLRGAATPLTAAGCYGPSAQVLTPVFGTSRSRAVRVAANIAGPITVGVVARGRRVARVRVRRHRGTVRVRLLADKFPCGPVVIRITGHGARFRLGALRVCGPSRRR